VGDRDAAAGEDVDLGRRHVDGVGGDPAWAEGAEGIEPGDDAIVPGAFADGIDDGAALRDVGADAEAALRGEALGGEGEVPAGAHARRIRARHECEHRAPRVAAVVVEQRLH
jgi:hypothetical protein